jgi:hypothetical protein
MRTLRVKIVQYMTKFQMEHHFSSKVHIHYQKVLCFLIYIYIRPTGICQQILLVHVIELQNEIKVNKEEDVALDDGKLMLKNLKIHSMMK